jgi:hypothetical protein
MTLGWDILAAAFVVTSVKLWVLIWMPLRQIAKCIRRIVVAPRLSKSS